MQEEGVFYALELSSAGFVSPAVSPLDWGVWTPHLLVSLPGFCMHNGDNAFWTCCKNYLKSQIKCHAAVSSWYQ